MFRKRNVFLLLFILSLSWGIGKEASASGAKQVLFGVNDEITNIQPIVKNDKYYASVRELAAVLNLQMTVSKQEIGLTDNNGKHLTLKRQMNQAVLSDGTIHKLQFYEDKGITMVPLGVIAANFGFDVAYDSSNHVLRAVNEKATLSQEQFLKKHKEVISEMTKSSNPLYLTFDDGPSSHTNQLLNILDKYDAKATFFMIGPHIKSYPAAVKRIVKDGHALGLHGMTHEKDKFYASPSAALKEMDQDNVCLNQVVNQTTTLIRTPYGSKPYFKKSFRDKVLGKGGYHLWDWNVDSLDWKFKNDSESIYNNVMKQVHEKHKSGEAPLILFHDQAATLKVLPRILTELKKEGYTFERLTPDMKPHNFWEDMR